MMQEFMTGEFWVTYVIFAILGLTIALWKGFGASAFLSLIPVVNCFSIIFFIAAPDENMREKIDILVSAEAIKKKKEEAASGQSEKEQLKEAVREVLQEMLVSQMLLERSPKDQRPDEV